MGICVKDEWVRVCCGIVLGEILEISQSKAKPNSKALVQEKGHDAKQESLTRIPS
jgi:hypothetical protein